MTPLYALLAYVFLSLLTALVIGKLISLRNAEQSAGDGEPEQLRRVPVRGEVDDFVHNGGNAL